MLSNMLHVDCQPSIIVFYGELALMKAIRMVFSKNYQYFMCSILRKTFSLNVSLRKEMIIHLKLYF